MSDATSTLRTLALHPVVEDRRVTTFLGVLAFALATAFGAWVAVPVTQVPWTLQPLFIVLSGAVLGPWAGAASMATYLGLGVAGAPVFSAGHAGLPWLLGPTGGYLLAAPASAFTVGLIAGRSRGRLRLFVALVAGMAMVYAGGVSQLFILTRSDLATLLAVGVVPFLAGDLVKVLLALVVARTARIHGSLGPR